MSNTVKPDINLDTLKEPFRKEEGWLNEVTRDTILHVLWWIVITAGAFAYWMAVLVLASIFLVNVWRTDLEELLRYGSILTIITSLVYAGMLIKKKMKR